MNELMHVGTRKGLFTLRRGKRGPGDWTIDRVHFLGDPVSMLLQDPRDGTLYASLALGHFGVKLRRSIDGGAHWEECAVPAYPKVEPPATASKSDSLQEIWSLEPGGNNEPAVIWAGTIPGGLFRSSDRGNTWELVSSLWNRPERSEWFGGGKDLPGIHSIAVDARDSRHVTVGISCGGVWVTRDGGESWSCQAQGMRAAFMPPERQFDPNIQDPHRVVCCPGAPDNYWTQHHNGIFRSVDDCASWHEITEPAVSGFGFAVAVHPREPDTAWFVPAVKDECRVPVDGKLAVTRTRDGGKTFATFREGLPQKHAYDIVYRHCLEVDSDGENLAMGSTTGSLWTSTDSGESWRALDARLPPIYCVRFA